MVHWVGMGSDVVICLAKDGKNQWIKRTLPSAVFISYDYGDSFENKTEYFALSDEKKAYASLDKFFNHPKFINHVREIKSKNFNL